MEERVKPFCRKMYILLISTKLLPDRKQICNGLKTRGLELNTRVNDLLNLLLRSVLCNIKNIALEDFLH